MQETLAEFDFYRDFRGFGYSGKHGKIKTLRGIVQIKGGAFMTCPEKEQMISWIYGELEDENLGLHFQTCQDCCLEIDRIRQVFNNLSSGVISGFVDTREDFSFGQEGDLDLESWAIARVNDYIFRGCQRKCLRYSHLADKRQEAQG